MLVVSKLVLDYASNIDIWSLNIPQAILARTKSRYLYFSSQKLWIFTITAILERVFDIIYDFVTQLQIFMRHALLLVYHPDQAFDLHYLLDTFGWLKIDDVLRAYIRIMFSLFGLNSLSVMLKINSIPWVFLGIPLIRWLFLSLTVAWRNIFKIRRIITGFWFFTIVLLLRFFLFFIIKRVFIIVTPLIASSRYKLCFNLVFNLCLLFFNRIFREESVGFHEQNVNFSSIQDSAFLQGEDNLFVVSSLEGGLKGT